MTLTPRSLQKSCTPQRQRLVAVEVDRTRGDAHPDAYAHSSVIDDAPRLERPLILIHGLADDNAVAAHTQRLSPALLAAGRPRTVLPLPGVTHMARQGEVAENLMLLQVECLERTLGMTPG